MPHAVVAECCKLEISTKYRIYQLINKITIRGRVDRSPTTETVASDSIPSQVKPKSIKIGSHKSFPS